MVTAAVFAALLALAVVLCGVAIGLGSERFWWVVERACLGLVALFLSGVQAGEWIGKTCAKLKRRESNVDGN